MRTLKKTLCLVLCLAMMVGLCAFGASASTFTDDADIQNKEAVDLLQGIGVLEGKPDGDGYKLDLVSTLTRAEACTIIYRLLGHGTKAYTKDTVFTDVTAAHWASGYIAFCYEAGIVAGVGHDLFKPNDPLTAAAWAKMLLCALGYDAEEEGLTGTSWKFNTTTLVARTKLAEGLEGGFDASAEMNRDNAALLSYNALTVPIVEYTGGLNVSAPDGTTIREPAERETSGDYLAENFGLKVGAKEAGAKDEAKHKFAAATVIKGVITENGFNALKGDETKIGATAYAFESGEDLLGHFVVAHLDETGKKVVSVTEIGSVVEVEKAIKANDTATFKSTFGAATVDSANTGVYCFKNGKGADTTYTIESDTKTEVGTYVFNEKGELVAELFDSYKVVTLDTVKTVDTTADKEYIELTVGGKLQNNSIKDEVREYEGIAKKDYVIVTKVGEVTYLEKPETVDGAISKYNAETGAITLDGTVYALSGAKDNIASPVAAAGITPAQMKNNTYTLFLIDGEYVRIEAKEAAVAPFEPYYVLTAPEKSQFLDQDTNKVVDKYFVKVVDQEGKISDVEVASTAADLSKNIVLISDVSGQTYKELATVKAADEAKYEVKSTAVETSAGDGNLKTSAKVDNYAGIRVNADTKFIFVSKNAKGVWETEVKTGLFDMDNALVTKAITKTDKSNNEIATLIYLDGAFTPAVVVDPSTTIYVADKTEYSSAVAAGYVYTVYDVTTGEAKSITMAKDNALAGKKGFYTFSTDSKGITTVSDYTIDTDAKLVSSVTMADTATGKYESKIQLTKAGEHAVADAVFVDLRAAADIKVGKVTDLDTLLAEKANVKIDALFNTTTKAVIAIFVY